MALVLKDRVKETTITTGVGALTLIGATTGSQSFSVIGDGNTTYYTIADPASGAWEVGIGTYTSSGTTLSRDTILASSNSGNVVNLGSGTKVVFCAYPSEKAVYYDASGNVGIGGSAGVGQSFVISTNATGATTTIGAFVNSQIKSDVTSTFRAFQATLSTEAAAFTITNVRGFAAFQSTFGAGSTVTNQAGFLAGSNLTGATNNYGFYGDIAAGTGRWNFYASGTADNFFAGGLGIGSLSLTGYNLRITKNITGAVSAFSVTNESTVLSDVTTQAFGYRSTIGTQATAFTLPSLFQYSAEQGTFGAGSTVTSQYGFITGTSLTGATNNYGFYGNIAAGTGRWNFYASGTASNYFAGSVGIGTTSVTGKSLVVNKQITGAVDSRGVDVSGQVQSDVTSVARYFISAANTVASAFTLGVLRHFEAFQGTIGAGSAVTSQYAFYADSTLTGATNNYGFYGFIAAGSGRWNFYAPGTANNAYAGASRFGSTTAPVNTVDVTGSFGRGAPVTKTGDFTLAATENWVINNKSGSACVVTLPAASSWTGREVMFVNYQAQQLNSASSNVVPISGGAAGTAILSATAGRWAKVVSDGTNWVITQGVI